MAFIPDAVRYKTECGRQEQTAEYVTTTGTEIKIFCCKYHAAQMIRLPDGRTSR